MKQQEVFKKIGGIVKEINEQYDYLQSVDEVYNDLELELMLANANFLADHIQILRKVNTQAAQAKPAIVSPAIETPQPLTEAEPLTDTHFFVPVPAQEPEPEAHIVEFKIDHKVEQPATPEPEPAQIRHELTLEDIGDEWDDDEPGMVPHHVAVEPAEPAPVELKPAQPVNAPEVNLEPQNAPIPQPAHTQIIVAEEQVLTFNERMSALANASRMTDQLVGQPITDLKSAISLNDKLLYIKELFNSYSLAYSEALDILNRYTTFEEAEAFLKASYATKNNWADKQDTVDKFYALLQRRYR